MTKWIYMFSDPAPCDGNSEACRQLLGGKGASLREMTAAGLAVPPGFTITTDACLYYYDNGRKWPPELAEQVAQYLSRLEKETGRTYGGTSKPLLVSVRSGAAVSMPGMMDTLLNCGLHPDLASDVGDTQEFWNLYIQFIKSFARTVHSIPESHFESAPPSRSEAMRCIDVYRDKAGVEFPTDPRVLLTECINAVFASWNSERAVAYRRKHDIREVTGTAVNVQMMFPSEVSGVVFTKDPNCVSGERMVIESSYGLGEAVVSGDVTPDLFYVNRDSMNVESRIGHKSHKVAALGSRFHGAPDAASLSTAQVQEMARLALKVEKFFGHPVDVEFGFADGKFALLQSRRIRGLDIAEDVEPGRQEEIHNLKAKAANGKRMCWVSHNLSETLRFPTPLTWSIIERFMSGSGGFGLMYRHLGYRPSKRVCEEGFLDLICGRIYADPERLSELFWDGMPLSYDVDQLVADKSLLDRAPSKFVAERADTKFLTAIPATLAAMIRSGRIVKKLRQVVRRRFEEEILPPYLKYVEAARKQDLSHLSDQELLAELRTRIRHVLDGFGPESLLPGFFGGMALAELQAKLEGILGQDAGCELTMTLTRALDGDTTFMQDAMLHRVAKGEETMDAFIEKFGHRAVGEMELSISRWREDRTYPLQLVTHLRASSGRTPADIHKENHHRRETAEANLEATLRKAGAGCLLEQVEAVMVEAQNLLPYRESGKHYLMMGYELIRLAVEALEKRWDLPCRIYFLELNELDVYSRNRSELDDIALARRVRWQALQRLDLPDVIDSADLDSLGLARPAQSSSSLNGTPVSAGVATGPARIVFNPQDAQELGTGYVLVCPSTDPGWTPLFLNAAALVVEKGGVLSHGAIVARDFGIPAVVCPNATRMIPAGRRVRVDGNKGHLDVLEDS